MKISLSVLITVVLFWGCSQDSHEDKENKTLKVEQKVSKKADKNEALVCLDEDEKITCKLMTKRLNRDRTVVFEWRSPDGKDTRERKMVLSANHASIYDMRSKKGRAKGKWTVEAAIDGEAVSTTFRID